ncbi:hypothetical protein HELRODRAFT_102635 [Helobdella robusta]|uniref:DRBM domain-containing protein n=1 Tax=Helobdella robusta TaxID=6412 RepID=T1EDA6_HELRO|nr:hypothetical protein HELRODRAFT_102635 [Helobdella robusta]ESN95413.1 hypothetical protein HELRODRAFT_102635 [Helobdella robusta]
MSEFEGEATPGKGKTPISYLQEICTKKGHTPQYDLVANEGAVHEPLFVFKVIAGDVTGTGKGPSKKKAKHNAAISALSQLLDCADVNQLASIISNMSNSDQPQSIKPQVLIDTGDNAEGNPVGELQEMMQKKMWPPPVYEYTSEQGPPHAREFVCTVSLFNFTEQAVGKSKKLAKRNAATVMLEKVRQGLVKPVENFSTFKIEDQDLDPLNKKSPLNDSSTTSAATTSTTKDDNFSKSENATEKRKTSSMFLNTKKNKPSTVLENLYKLHSSSDENQNGDFDDEDISFENDGDDARELIGNGVKDPCSMRATTIQPASKFKNKWMSLLCDLSVEQKFLITFHDLPYTTDKGIYQCIVHLSTVPPVVSHGSGSLRSKARVQAVKNSLNNIVTLTKKMF